MAVRSQSATWGPDLKRLIEQASQRLRRACQTAEIWLESGSQRCWTPLIPTAGVGQSFENVLHVINCCNTSGNGLFNVPPTVVTTLSPFSVSPFNYFPGLVKTSPNWKKKTFSDSLFQTYTNTHTQIWNNPATTKQTHCVVLPVPCSSLHSSHHAPDQLHHEQLHVVVAAAWAAQRHHPGLRAALLREGEISFCSFVFLRASYHSVWRSLLSCSHWYRSVPENLWTPPTPSLQTPPGLIISPWLSSLCLSHCSLVSAGCWSEKVDPRPRPSPHGATTCPAVKMHCVLGLGGGGACVCVCVWEE